MTKMIYHLLLSALLLISATEAQIILDKPNTYGSVERGIISQLSLDNNRKNPHIRKIVHELKQYCRENDSLCGDNSMEVINVNALKFATVAPMLTQRDGHIGDTIRAIIDTLGDLVGAVLNLIIQTLTLIIRTGVNFIVAELNLIVVFFSTLATSMGDLAEEMGPEVRIAEGLTHTVIENIRIWAEKLDIEDNNNGDRRLKGKKDDTEKLEKLQKIVEFSALGYLIGGGDALTSVQYSASAYAYLSNWKMD